MSLAKALPLSILLGFLLYCCEKPGIISDPSARLEFSVDTVLFDTVFTTIGSTTHHFKVYNRHSQAILVDRIALAGGESSRFRLNINGRAGNELTGVEIPSRDSIFIFVEVTLDPNGLNDPMVIKDSVTFMTNNNFQDVDLVAFGQDVHLFAADTIGNETWVNDKPYLVYGYVYVDSLKTLTIDPGVRIHFHNRSSLLVGGTLVVNGTLDQPVSFQGDRLEPWYDNNPGQWGAWLEYDNGARYFLGGIHLLNGSKNNRIRHAIIKNATKGIQLDTLASRDQPTLIIENSTIENMSIAGIYAQSSSLLAINCVINYCKQWCVALTLGGHYEFYHCTINNSASNPFDEWIRTDPAVLLNNFYIYGNQAYVYQLEQALFANCIISGNRQIEIGFANTINQVPVPGAFNYHFDHCLVKVDTLNTSDETHWTSITKNVDPRYASPAEHNYRLDSLSPARGKAKAEYALLYPLDYDGVNRTEDGKPDLGAFEWITKHKGR